MAESIGPKKTMLTGLVLYVIGGNEGVVWILAGLYLISAVLTKFITIPKNVNNV